VLPKRPACAEYFRKKVLGFWTLGFEKNQRFQRSEVRSQKIDQRSKTQDQRPKTKDGLINMKDAITVYEKPTCTKCREMDRFLRESGTAFAKVNYYVEPLGQKKLAELIRKMKIRPRDLLRKSEPIYRELGLGKDEFTDDQIISLMVKYPDLIQRPIVERGSRAVLGRPTENVKTLL
jgi:arsenate reductase (glutaredoxin)